MGKLMLVGCGKMGGAMLEGWLARGLSPQDIVVAEPVRRVCCVSNRIVRWLLRSSAVGQMTTGVGT